MREILFRGKRMDNGKWAEGFIVASRENTYPDGFEIITVDGINYDELDRYIPGFISYAVDPSTVGQYTCLKDKNGERIFEGDVCRFREWSNGEMCWVGKVHWEHQQFMISGGPNKECETMFELCLSRFIPENIEVIGNIHDNPELLEK